MKYLLLIATLFTSTICFAQQNPINTDRPDQSDGTYILTKNKFQIENGLLFAKQTVVNNFMLRYGISNSTEIRFLADAGSVEKTAGLQPLTLSVKQRLVKQKNALPEITLVGYIRNEKIASKKFSGNETTYSMLLAFQNDITDNFSIGYNIGTTSFKDDASFTTSFGYSVSKHFTVFAEYFGRYNKFNAADHNMDIGLLYAVKENLQLDIAFGSSLQNNEARYITTGISYRF
jgi:hypothetical protein